MMKAYDVAIYFLDYVCRNEEYGELISNLKLQKLLYYAQGLHLAIYDMSLFDEPIEAWQHGPVVREMYDAFKVNGSDHIPCPIDVDYDHYKPEIRQFLEDVYSAYGQYSAWALRELTHQEAPWQDTPQNDVISHEKLKAYFVTQLV